MAVDARLVGVRVVRGPDWSHLRQDGGEGGVGTVVSPASLTDSSDSAAGHSQVPSEAAQDLVTVLWDSGRVGTYRCGTSTGARQLRVFDTTAQGSFHAGVQCSGCGTQPIVGVLWQCSECSSQHLCSVCYHHEAAHDLTHRFFCCPFPDSPRMKVPERNGGLLTTTSGVFPGAKVHPGPHWRHGDMISGKPRPVGNVISILSGSGVSESERGKVLVRWPGGKEITHSLGHDGGKVGISCAETASGPVVFLSHFPPLCPGEDAGERTVGTGASLRVGDLVHVPPMDLDVLHALQQGRPHRHISDLIYQVGEVDYFELDSGDPFVAYHDRSQPICLNRAVLEKVPSFRKGDAVRVIDDHSVAMAIIMAVNGWDDQIATVFDSIGVVSGLARDHLVNVVFGYVSIALHPACLQHAHVALDPERVAVNTSQSSRMAEPDSVVGDVQKDAPQNGTMSSDAEDAVSELSAKKDSTSLGSKDPSRVVVDEVTKGSEQASPRSSRPTRFGKLACNFSKVANQGAEQHSAEMMAGDSSGSASGTAESVPVPVSVPVENDTAGDKASTLACSATDKPGDVSSHPGSLCRQGSADDLLKSPVSGPTDDSGNTPLPVELVIDATTSIAANRCCECDVDISGGDLQDESAEHLDEAGDAAEAEAAVTAPPEEATVPAATVEGGQPESEANARCADHYGNVHTTTDVSPSLRLLSGDGDLCDVITRIFASGTTSSPATGVFSCAIDLSNPVMLLAKSVASDDTDTLRVVLQCQREHVNGCFSPYSIRAVHVAACFGKDEGVRLLHEFGADIEAQLADGSTALHIAALRNEVDTIQALSSLGADPDITDKEQCTALHLTAIRGCLQACEELITAGANTNAQDCSGSTPLHCACQNDRMHVADCLLAAGADMTVCTQSGMNATECAAAAGSTEILELLLDRSPQLANVAGDDGFRPLHHAVLHGNYCTASLLLNREEIDVNVRGPKLDTPLMLAALHGDKACVELLVRSNADLNAEDACGNTALHTLCYRVSDDGIDCDVAVVGRDRRSLACDQATGISPSIDMVEMLLSFETPTKNTMTAIACFLAERGADLDYYNHDFKTPLELCSDPAMAEIIRAYSPKERAAAAAAETRAAEYEHSVFAAQESAASNHTAASPYSIPILVTPAVLRTVSMEVNVPDERPHSTGTARATSGNTDGTQSGDGAGDAAGDADLPEECVLCESLATVMFEPCGHIQACTGQF
eukprot:scpid26341/ scgid5881/ E3 ubiquitin-protein ligase mind-bomb; Mind bomb homolog